MKELLIGLLALGSLSSYAAEEFQANNISGDWKCIRSNGVQTVKRISLKENNDILINVCNKTKYYETSGTKCSYYYQNTAKYNSFYDGYCVEHKQDQVDGLNLVTKKYPCGIGMRVYDLGPEKINMMWDPLKLYSRSNSGTYYGDCKKIK